MSESLALQLHLVAQAPESLWFRLLMRNSSAARFIVPRPAVSCLRFGNMATGKESPWRTQWLVSAPWNGFFLEPGQVKEIEYRVRPCSVARPKESNRSEYARCCVELSEAEYLVWMKFEVTHDYFCRDSHYRYADLVWDALSRKALVWTGLAMSNRLNLSWNSEFR
jgi:hypothetical protein